MIRSLALGLARRHPAMASRTKLSMSSRFTQGIKWVFRESYLLSEGWLGAVRVAFGRIHG